MLNDKLKALFMSILNIEASSVTDNLTYNSIPAWDSVGHMALIAAIEDEFDIMLDTDDVLDMSSFAKAKEILKKYDL